jgi:enoyl-CoA hydratase/carnithine racemase
VPLDQLRAAATKLAQEIAENAPLAVQSVRTTFRTDLAAAVREQTALELKEQSWLRKTSDYVEGVKAVGERRPGNFTGS